LSKPERVRLRIVDVQGRVVTTVLEESLDAGGHTAAWTGRDDHGRAMPAGVYLVVLEAGTTRRSERLVRMP
jgi:flagellar hook assembly protein FlgD